MPFFYPITPFPDLLKSKTLIVPVVSVANVSQLAVDLLIASLNLKRIGLFDARDVIPVVGAREEGEEGVTTPLELYGKDSFDVVILQQRSPALKARKESFTNSLIDFVYENKMSGLLLLTGVDLSNRTDSQMSSPIYKLVSPSQTSLENSGIRGISKIPTYTFAPSQQSPSLASHPPSKSAIPFIPGGGLTRRLLSVVPPVASPPIPTAAILQFAFEGDNRADAEHLAVVVARTLGLDSAINQWKQPKSWSVGLFGTPHDQSLYG